MLDLLVIGAGLSGLTAAYTAAEAGRSVRVIAKGLGALHWSAGTLDLLGYLPGVPKTPVQRPFEALAALTAEAPQHPYALLGREAIREALARFVDLTAAVGLPYGGAADPAENLLLPSPAGAVRPTWLAPQAQLGGDLRRPEPLLIVGFRGLRDFYPDLIAENLAKQGYRARPAFLPLALITDRRDANTIHLAAELDDPARREALGRALRGLVRPGERIGLPAVLGLRAHTAALTALTETSGAPVFEIPTLPPSVPGTRLYQALRDRLLEMGVRIEAAMEATRAETTAAVNGSPGRVLWVESATSARPLKHRAHAFLLATGGILGGGFDSDHTGRVWETIFDLPLTIPQDRSAWFAPNFLSPTGHPVFNGGIAVDQAWRPTADGRPIYANLHAAGSLLAHADPILERSLEGLAVAAGFAAGRAACA